VTNRNAGSRVNAGMTVGALLFCASLAVYGQTNGAKTVLVAAILGVAAMLALLVCTVALIRDWTGSRR
jgi:hypothetical protein